MFLNLPANLEAGVLFFAGSANGPQALPAYEKLDVSLRWCVSRAMDLSLTAQNLLHEDDFEFHDIAAPVTLSVRMPHLAHEDAADPLQEDIGIEELCQVVIGAQVEHTSSTW
ncbi:MAG: hypothetical protein A3F70_18945 [Acidobacteria bacterium RIFCSPLOWO2_12_FULL_67_14]|nr:MAG: hypothetical protein A3H29_04925 [Acidobacteria bacterium RIFCSPLOWO2_02_FULL_67_21]OFW35741.1 MAG: hypothetical protein A3F70_18945 [Acidobacteria bacterium RIFCSPLOWO2_12_FULL_67_14]